MTSVSELMVPLEEYSHVAVGASLGDVIKTLAGSMMGAAADPSRPGDRAVLVQAQDGRVIGKLSMWDLLSGLRPHYEPPIDPFGPVEDHLLWSQWLRPDLVERARSVKAEDLLEKPVRDETIEDTAPLDLAVYHMVRARRLSLLVTRGEAIVGILRLSDVFKAINDMICAAQSRPASV